MRAKIVAGNWKMNKSFKEGVELARAIIKQANVSQSHQRIILHTPFIHLMELSREVKNNQGVFLGAQNVHQEEKGAFTGEISAAMLQSCSVQYCLVGHSERRQFFGESGKLLAEKVNILLKHKIQPVFCCGEKLETREADDHFNLVERQLEEAVFHLSNEAFSQLVLAYEPVWAIGTGKTASPEQAQEMHAFIRNCVGSQYGQDLAENLSILYGGSCKPSNAAMIFEKEDVDGGLIGGASLLADDFLAIFKALP